MFIYNRSTVDADNKAFMIILNPYIIPIFYFYTCGLSTPTIEYSCPSVCLCVCLSVYTTAQK